MKVLGIDPGLKGGFAFLGDKTSSIGRLPVVGLKRNRKERSELDVQSFYRLLCTERPDTVVIENVGGIKGQGAGGAFTVGDTCGALRAACLIYAATFGLTGTFYKVSPVVWRARMGVRRICVKERVDAKEGSRRAADRIFPDHSAAWRARKEDDGVAEALLIAAYWKRFGANARD